MASVMMDQVSKFFGPLQVIKEVDLNIKSGEFIVFVGPSGCGKSTLLRLIAGLEDITSGTLKIGGEVANDLPPAKRGVAMVFQSYALYPHMTVYENIAFGLKLAGGGREEIDKRVQSAAGTLRIENLLARRPRELSGGQRQRVAIGRAIVRNPRVFLFDEPLSNLDAALRVATRIEITKLHERMSDTTMIYVTHDQVEAMTLADRIVVLNAGQVEQIGAPIGLYRDPANLFVAQFIGSPAMNTVPAVVETGGGKATVRPDGGQPIAVDAAVPGGAAGAQATFGVRPEHLRPANGHDTIFKGEVAFVEDLGEVTLVYLDCGRPDQPIIAKLPGSVALHRGETLGVTADTEDLYLFDDKGMMYPRSVA